jgi:hypothetical protein
LDLGTVGSIASVIGLVVAIVIAVHQRGEALKAQQKAESERARAASLEDHLARQRWQQLRSLGEQIDTLELEGSHKHEPMEAALHARLKEQYGGLLGVVATSTPGFCSSTVRHWVTIGRLPRPWQVAEAITHLEKAALEGAPSEDERWLAELIKSTTVVPKVQAIQPARELNQYVASYILVAHSVREELRDLLGQGGQASHSAAVLLYHLALDCQVALSLNKPGKPMFRTWGSETGKSFRERFNYYQTQDFWIMVAADDKARDELKGFEHLFEPMSDRRRSLAMLVPTSKAAETARSRYPELAEAAASVFRARKS